MQDAILTSSRQLRPRNSIKKEDGFVSSDSEDKMAAGVCEAHAVVPVALSGRDTTFVVLARFLASCKGA